VIDILFFVLQIVGVATLLGWAVVNDRIKQDAAVRGPLAYKDQKNDAAKPPVPKMRRRGLTRS